MFPGTWGFSRHVRFACHTSSMHIQSTKAMYLQIHSKLEVPLRKGEVDAL